MNRFEKAAEYHHKGFNCCQSVLAAYTDLTGLTEQASFDLGAALAPAPRRESCAAPSPGPL